MRALTNPLLLRMAIVFVAALFSFLLGLTVVRQFRRKVQEETDLGKGDPSTENFPLHTYHAVIQQLKQQKHELQSLQQAERRRAQATENVSAAVLSNLSCGVLFFNTRGLVRQANAAAKSILGFASPVGMNAIDLFRNAHLERGYGPGEEPTTMAEAVANTLQNAANLRRVAADYRTPSGQQRVLEVTVSPVYAANAELMGAACLINDHSEIAEIRRQLELRGEISAEMALQLRNSLLTISGYANSLAQNRDAKIAAQLANDIANEAEHLQKTIGHFLASGKAAAAASGLN